MENKFIRRVSQRSSGRIWIPDMKSKRERDVSKMILKLVAKRYTTILN